MFAKAEEVMSRLSYENDMEGDWYENPQLTGQSKTDEDTNWFEVRDDKGHTGWWGLQDDGWDDGTNTLVQLLPEGETNAGEGSAQ